MNKQHILIYILFFTTIILSCNKPYTNIDTIANLNFNGAVTKIESLGSYSRESAVSLLQLADLPQTVTTTCGYQLFRIQYKTTNYDNTTVIASGLMAVPDNKTIKGIVSWQHGTNSTRSESVSVPTPSEGLGLSSLFAGDGYILLAPDYIGLGTSTILHPYLHLKSTIASVIDFLKIGEVVLNKVSNNSAHNLYLIGFSQGASASMGVQRSLELNNPTKLILKANAPIAGPYNIRNIGIKYALVNNSTFYLGYLCNSYSAVYNQPLASFIKSPYDQQIPEWYNGTKEYDFLVQNLPKKVTELFTDSFYNDLKNDKSFWFTNALDENETYQWKPISPVQFFYGASDVDLSPQESVQAYNYMKAIGGNVSIQNVGPFEHTPSLLQSLPSIQTWFNSIK
jgi:hypothetical protein